jgi:hypothetical protein
VVGEGARRAGVAEHGADHREVDGAGTSTGLRALALRAVKKSGRQHQNLQRRKREPSSRLLHGAALALPHTEFVPASSETADRPQQQLYTYTTVVCSRMSISGLSADVVRIYIVVLSYSTHPVVGR